MAEEAKFGKSKSNRRTENRGLAILLGDPRFQVPDLATKRRLVELLRITGDFGARTFDAVMTLTQTKPLTPENIAAHAETIRLVEMKTTVKPVKNAMLNGFFFGATEREYLMAKELGDRYLFAFVVLNNLNEFGRPFVVLLTLDQVEERTKTKRLQFQVNLRNDMTPESFSPGMIVVGGQDAASQFPKSDTV